MRQLDDAEFSQRAVELALEFNRYVIEHPKVTTKLPLKAQVVLLIAGDEEYNEWARHLAEYHGQKVNRPLVYLTIKRLRPIRSRIAGLELAQISG